MILLTLSRGKGEETVRLQLPASPAEIGETFAFLDRISLDTTATAILDVSSNVPVLYRCLYDVDVEDSEQFQKLQKLAERTEALSPAKAAIFSGALDAECVWNLEGALTVADRLDEYMLVNNVSSDSELGIYLVNKGIIPFPDRFKPYINYARVGAEYREKHGGEYSSGNYVQKKTPELLENERLDGVFRIWMENPCPVRVQSETAQITLPATFEQLESARQLLGVDSLNIVNPQNMQKEDFVKGGTATGPMLDFLAACLRYGVSVCVAGATGSGKTTVAGWLLTTIPDNKRIFTIENGSRELDLVREKDGRVCNSVIHTITRESENAKQNIDQDMLLDMALRYHPDIICVGEMRSAEAYAAQEAARTGHGVLTTIHSNSSQATWRRMVTLCKRKHEMADDTLMDLVTEAFPIVVFAKQLEDKSRKIMEIMECEILPTGERRYNTLYHFKIEENRLEDGKYRIKGRHEAVNPISESLQKRFIDNGMPQEVLTQLVGKKSAPSKGKSGSSPAKAGQATPAPKTRSAQSKPPAKPETGKEGGESV